MLFRSGKSEADDGKSEADDGKSEADEGKPEADDGKSEADEGKKQDAPGQRRISLREHASDDRLRLCKGGCPVEKDLLQERILCKEVEHSRITE